MLKIPFHLCSPFSCFSSLWFAVTLICFHGSSVLFDDHFFFHLTLPLAFLGHLLSLLSFSPSFSHQSLQGMLLSLHSELDIQRYLMKIQLPHRVSRPFILSTSCHCVCGYVCILTNICCATMFPAPVPSCLVASALSVPAKHTWLPG